MIFSKFAALRCAVDLGSCSFGPQRCQSCVQRAAGEALRSLEAGAVGNVDLEVKL